MQWRLRTHHLNLDTSVVMGIINITPDSFSDGGQFLDPHLALAQAKSMEAEGAGILDVGAESTRPGAKPLSPEAEWNRLQPVLKLLQSTLHIPISVDTYHGATARQALNFGVEIINDISMGQDPDLLAAVRGAGAGYVLMHMRGNPETMMDHAKYDSVVADVKEELQRVYQNLLDQGLNPLNICIDPGFGFAKTPSQNAELLLHLNQLKFANRPLMVGLSRKRMLRECVGSEPEKLQAASVAACMVAARQGARIFRVHDVAATVQALQMEEILTNEAAQGEET